MSKKIEGDTQLLSAAFQDASILESSEWCKHAQTSTISYLPLSFRNKIKDIQVIVVENSSATLEHSHTKVDINSDGTLNLTIASYAFYNNNSWNPADLFAPTYSSANDISCKLVSADKIAKALGASKYFPSSKPNITCAQVNQEAIEVGFNLLQKYWPSAVTRFKNQGRQFKLKEDSKTIAGPQWVFLSSLKFDEGSKNNDPSIPVNVQSPYLYSSVNSKIFPGNFYCKLLSPAKVVEWIMTRGLTKRYK